MRFSDKGIQHLSRKKIQPCLRRQLNRFGNGFVGEPLAGEAWHRVGLLDCARVLDPSGDC